MPKQDLISISGSERQPVARTLLPSVNHFVVVMLENRSFDHMLGFLYAAQGNVSPLRQPFEGLTGNETNPDGKGGRVKVFKILPTDPHPYFMPGANPGEGYLNTNWQLFGTEQAPVPIIPSTNQGFVTNFASTLAWESKQKGRVMPGTTLPFCLDSQASVEAKLVTNPCLVEGMIGTGACSVPNNCQLVFRYPSPGFAPGMKYGCGSVGRILKTLTRPPFPSGLVSLPVRPSNGWLRGETLP